MRPPRPGRVVRRPPDQSHRSHTPAALSHGTSANRTIKRADDLSHDRGSISENSAADHVSPDAGGRFVTDIWSPPYPRRRVRRRRRPASAPAARGDPGRAVAGCRRRQPAGVRQIGSWNAQRRIDGAWGRRGAKLAGAVVPCWWWGASLRPVAVTDQGGGPSGGRRASTTGELVPRLRRRFEAREDRLAGG